mgnify:CR=1 FL=1
MEKRKILLHDALCTLLLLGGAVAVCSVLSRVHDDNNPFAVLIFVLAVAIVALVTTGYVWGVVASVVGVFCVNYMFAYPFWSFDMSISGYPLTFMVMLVVSVVISTLTTRLKQTERLRYEVESEKLRADLLRALSHDLRTPLASIEGAGSLLLEQPDLTEAERRTLLEQIRQETRWLTRITENMLSITRMAGGQVALRRTDEVVEEIVDGAVMKLRRSSASLPVTVERPQEIITAPMVSIARQEKMVQITVLDDGCGFPPELPGSLTEGGALPLARSCADGRRGLGLGLTLCSAIIKAHGGRMTAENRPEGGAQVTLWLPAGNDTEEAPYEAL